MGRAALNQEFIADAQLAIVVLVNIGKSSWVYGDMGATLHCPQEVLRK